MIKFRIHPKIRRGRGANLEMLEKCKNYSFFFYIFWDIINEMKDNMGQECVKGVLLYFQSKIGTISLEK